MTTYSRLFQQDGSFLVMQFRADGGRRLVDPYYPDFVRAVQQGETITDVPYEPLPELPPQYQPSPAVQRAARYKNEADPFLAAYSGYCVELLESPGDEGIIVKRDAAMASYLAAKERIRQEIPD